MEILIFFGLIAIIVIFFVSIYNSLVGLRNQVKNAWSQIDVQLKRRHDLIPNLVETAKGYMKHERETLENITNARSQAMGAEKISDKSSAEGALSGAISKFFLVVENYGDGWWLAWENGVAPLHGGALLREKDFRREADGDDD